MKEYVSLLRGINVGGRNILMTDLLKTYKELGLVNAKSFLQSGNVTFNYEEQPINILNENITQKLLTKYKFPIKVFILEKDKLSKIVNEYPLITTDINYQNYIIFLENDLEKMLYQQGKGLSLDIENIQIGDGVIYWSVKKGMTVKSNFSKLLIKKEFREFHTNRNLNTLKKILS